MRRVVVAGALAVVVALTGVMVLLSRDSSTPITTPTPSPSTASPAPTAAPTATPTAQPKRLVLNGSDLGVTNVGASQASAVAAISEVLGAPLHDPATSASCFRADREVDWGAFRLAFTNGRLAGWLSRDPALRTPSGVSIGTTVSTLRRVYRGRLSLYPANTDNSEGFSVLKVDLRGSLTGLGAADTVTTLFSGDVCEGP